MEQLTKQQIVLVTLLVSFVTSIATGIVTVALMDQAPPGVTQTINRVVERTIEKVVPAPNQPQAAAVVTKETIVVKEDDLVVKAVEKNTKSVVSILKVTAEGDSQNEKFIGNGLVISKDGTIASDSSVAASVVDENGNPIAANLKAVFSDGLAMTIATVSSGGKSGIALFKPKADDKNKNHVFVSADIADASALKLGQTVIALGGEKLSVATGIVSNFSQASGSTAATSTESAKISQIIKTNIPHLSKTPGTILINLSGDVVGIQVGTTVGDGAFLPANLVNRL